MPHPHQLFPTHCFVETAQEVDIGEPHDDRLRTLGLNPEEIRLLLEDPKIRSLLAEFRSLNKFSEFSDDKEPRSKP